MHFPIVSALLNVATNKAALFAKSFIGPILPSSSSVIKSIQRGTIFLYGVTSTYVDVTPVDPSQSELRFLGCKGSQGDTRTDLAYIELTGSGTRITATRNDATGTCTVSYELVEYY